MIAGIETFNIRQKVDGKFAAMTRVSSLFQMYGAATAKAASVDS